MTRGEATIKKKSQICNEGRTYVGQAVNLQSAGEEITKSFSGSAMGLADSLISLAKKSLKVLYFVGSGSIISCIVFSSWNDLMKGMI